MIQKYTYAVVVSKKDPVGMNIKDILLSGNDLEETEETYEDNPIFINKSGNFIIVTIDERTIFAENIDLDVEIIIFATTHRSEDKRPIFSCHSPGNWNDALLGGKSRELGICPANVLKKAYLILNQMNSSNVAPAGFLVTMECTHHGPYTKKPCIFMEIGSTEKEWENKQAAEMMVKSIIKLCSEEIVIEKSALGVGGTHYCSSFMKVNDSSAIAVGHICPKHMLPNLDKEMILQALDRTVPKVELVILDWKGLGAEKQRIIALLDELAIPYQKARNVRENLGFF
jgi:D-aminoacyl-tRNA deacylase